MDPLSDILALLKPRASVSAGFEAGGAWAVRYTGQEGFIKCYAVTRGGCWLAVEDGPAPVWIETGGCFVLPRGRNFTLGSDLALSPTDSRTLFPPPRPGGVVRLGEASDFALVGSRFRVEGGEAMLLLDALPFVMTVDGAADQAALRWAVERMMAEMWSNQPGSALVAQQLAQIVLVQALRHHLAQADPSSVGWFFALGDKRLCAALAAIHAEPGRRWTLASLATVAGMSRASFAEHFRARAGETPMGYLARWRMLLAGDRLRRGEGSVGTIATALGYESESAFSTAFKRRMGRSPRSYGRDAEKHAA